MACVAYKELFFAWRRLVYALHTDDESVAAYWKAIEHREACEVCRDEDIAQAFDLPPAKPDV